MFYLIQAGDVIYVVAENGTVYTALVMPAGVTVDATKRARFATLNQKVVISNAVSVNVWVDPATFTVYKLAIAAPTTNLAAAQGASTGGLTGAYLWRYSFVQKIGGVVVNESPLSPAMAAPVVINGTASLSSIDVDSTVGTATTGRRIYRTAAGGSDYFNTFEDIDDNVTTVLSDIVSDAGLDLLPADITVTNAAAGSDGASRLTLLVEHKDILFGVGSQAALVDQILYTNPKQIYAWSANNQLPAAPTGADSFGIVGYAPRRDGLCIFKRARLLKLIGSSNADFAVIPVMERVGCIASDSLVIINDTIYWLGADGVYSWDDNDTISCVSRAAVDGWFTSDTYFDRTQFSIAWGNWNPVTNCYELSMVPAGGTDLTAWVAMELTTGKWFGPHLTGAFTPTGRQLLRTSAGIWRPMMGGADGYAYLQNVDGSDDVAGSGALAQVVSSWTITPMTQGDPTLTHFWGEVHATFREEANGVTLALTPTVGNLESVTAFTVTMPLSGSTKARLRRIGVGSICFLQFEQNALGARFLLYGLDVTPISLVGRRL
jgi:hypothetical protein